MAQRAEASTMYKRNTILLMRQLLFLNQEYARCSIEYNMTTLTQEQKEALMADLRSFDDTLRVDDFGESK